MNKYRAALDEIILYLNATEPTGEFCKDIELLLEQNELLKLYKQHYELGINLNSYYWWEEKKKVENQIKELEDDSKTIK